MTNDDQKRPDEKIRQAGVDTTKSQREDDTPQLPNERDESHASQASAPRDIMKQAHQDIESGQVDTELRGTRGVDAVNQPAPAKSRESAGEKFGTPEADKTTADGD
ncbi:MAG: hypothetical protein H7315_15490 [Herminiimonas sp.]|nr:hypothetical protein [Herminiimonas sp.]